MPSYDVPSMLLPSYRGVPLYACRDAGISQMQYFVAENVCLSLQCPFVAIPHLSGTSPMWVSSGVFKMRFGGHLIVCVAKK